MGSIPVGRVFLVIEMCGAELKVGGSIPPGRTIRIRSLEFGMRNEKQKKVL